MESQRSYRWFKLKNYSQLKKNSHPIAQTKPKKCCSSHFSIFRRVTFILFFFSLTHSLSFAIWTARFMPQCAALHISLKTLAFGEIGVNVCSSFASALLGFPPDHQQRQTNFLPLTQVWFSRRYELFWAGLWKMCGLKLRE